MVKIRFHFIEYDQFIYRLGIFKYEHVKRSFCYPLIIAINRIELISLDFLVSNSVTGADTEVRTSYKVENLPNKEIGQSKRRNG